MFAEGISPSWCRILPRVTGIMNIYKLEEKVPISIISWSKTL
jgi:hypothetical protein